MGSSAPVHAKHSHEHECRTEYTSMAEALGRDAIVLKGPEQRLPAKYPDGWICN
jgi:hypothetical protein